MASCQDPPTFLGAFPFCKHKQLILMGTYDHRPDFARAGMENSRRGGYAEERFAWIERAHA